MPSKGKDFSIGLPRHFAIALWHCTIVHNPQFVTPENTPSFYFDLRKPTSKRFTKKRGGADRKDYPIILQPCICKKLIIDYFAN